MVLPRLWRRLSTFPEHQRPGRFIGPLKDSDYNKKTNKKLPAFSYRETVTVPLQFSVPDGSKTNSVYSQPWNRFDKRPKKEKQICGQRLLRK